MKLDEFDAVDVYPRSGTPLALSIYSSPGLRTQKLHIPFLAIVIKSLLILSQITGLLIAVYTSMQPTWTAALDGFAMLRMGKAMSGDALPRVSAADVKEALVFVIMEGWIGDENDENDEGNEVGEGFLLVGGSGCVGIDIQV